MGSPHPQPWRGASGQRRARRPAPRPRGGRGHRAWRRCSWCASAACGPTCRARARSAGRVRVAAQQSQHVAFAVAEGLERARGARADVRPRRAGRPGAAARTRVARRAAGDAWSRRAMAGPSSTKTARAPLGLREAQSRPPAARPRPADRRPTARPARAARVPRRARRAGRPRPRRQRSARGARPSPPGRRAFPSTRNRASPHPRDGQQQVCRRSNSGARASAVAEALGPAARLGPSTLGQPHAGANRVHRAHVRDGPHHLESGGLVEPFVGRLGVARARARRARTRPPDGRRRRAARPRRRAPRR